MIKNEKSSESESIDLHIYVSPALHDAVKMLADHTNTTMRRVVSNIVKNHIAVCSTKEALEYAEESDTQTSTRKVLRTASKTVDSIKANRRAIVLRLTPSSVVWVEKKIIVENKSLNLFVTEILLDYFVNEKDSIGADFQLDDTLFSDILYEFLEVSSFQS